MKKGLYQFEGTPAEVLDRLRAVQQADDVAERKVQNSGCAAGLCFLVALAFGVSGAHTESTPLLALGGVFGVAFVLCLVSAIRAEAHNLDDAKILAPVHLLQVIGADLPPGRPIRLKVDFRDYPYRDFQVARQGGGFFSRETLTTYRQPWFALDGRLADGARFSLEVLRKAERRDYWKSSGGKSKKRFKDKVQDEISLRLQVPGLDLSTLVANLTPGIPGGMVGKDMKIQGDLVRMEVLTPRARRTFRHGLGPGDLAHADRLLGLLVWAYRGVQGVRATSTRPPAAAG